MTQELTAPSGRTAGTTGLRRNAVGLAGAVIMSAAIMGPAVSTFFNPQFSTPFSGYATPLVYLLCLIAMLITASGVMEMARALPSAGAFYTYVTRGLGPRAGFVTGGLMFVAYALLPPAEIGLIGSYLQSTFNTEFSVDIPWWVIGLVPAAFMIFLAYEGIQSSIRTAMVLFTMTANMLDTDATMMNHFIHGANVAARLFHGVSAPVSLLAPSMPRPLTSAQMQNR